jgi:hypothetical protein
MVERNENILWGEMPRDERPFQSNHREPDEAAAPAVRSICQTNNIGWGTFGLLNQALA